MPGNTLFRSPPDLSVWFKKLSSVILYLKATLPHTLKTHPISLPWFIFLNSTHFQWKVHSLAYRFVCLPLLEGTCSVSFTSISTTSRRHSINTAMAEQMVTDLKDKEPQLKKVEGRKALILYSYFESSRLLRRVLVDCEEGIREGSKGRTYTCPQEASPRGNTGWAEEKLIRAMAGGLGSSYRHLLDLHMMQEAKPISAQNMHLQGYGKERSLAVGTLVLCPWVLILCLAYSICSVNGVK